jgi:predicted aspartyl protease
MIYTYEYDADYPFGPAMPMVEIQIRSVRRNEDSISVRAVVDSGADATILPVQFLESAGIDKVGRARMRWGKHYGQEYDVYLAIIEIGPFQFPGIRVLADKQESEPILGRDVLNHLALTLNGPANVVEISTD